jgi:hypothetical protein
VFNKNKEMSEIQCLEKYKRLREMLIRGVKGNANYFSDRLDISKRTFYRLIKYLKEIEQLNIRFDRHTDEYYLE